MLGLKTSSCTESRGGGGGGGEFAVGQQRTLDVRSYHYLFGGTEQKIDEKSMQLNLTL